MTGSKHATRKQSQSKKTQSKKTQSKKTQSKQSQSKQPESKIFEPEHYINFLRSLSPADQQLALHSGIDALPPNLAQALNEPQHRFQNSTLWMIYVLSTIKEGDFSAEEEQKGRFVDFDWTNDDDFLVAIKVGCTALKWIRSFKIPNEPTQMRVKAWVTRKRSIQIIVDVSLSDEEVLEELAKEWFKCKSSRPRALETAAKGKVGSPIQTLVPTRYFLVRPEPRRAMQPKVEKLEDLLREWLSLRSIPAAEVKALFRNKNVPSLGVTEWAISSRAIVKSLTQKSRWLKIQDTFEKWEVLCQQKLLPAKASVVYRVDKKQPVRYIHAG